ncbi:ATP-binding protein [Bacillus inaquosorum]|uniref:ATP-binding protein n=1 Tax=Bacillus inaquosorum TaxID=483913 RepID=UPI002282508A|nr:ATP-binding protein [Bacillus inaquosorum]MCY8724760.1 ATP-binding protein [Bacillus inaquosorum]MCY8790482.1 ATP-binding protein [Bacillus inaquosorum]MEC0636394.1 ATP-binding protein [Bacillus inaquosorum]
MRFTINSRVLEHLGKDLITSNEVAISELIKNAYDAGANKVQLHFIENVKKIELKDTIAPVTNEITAIIQKYTNKDKRIIILEDDGDGMTYEDLEKGFFTIGTDIKKKQKAQKNFNKRLPLGEKGIGRLASQRLSKVLFIETTNLQSKITNVVRVNWDDLTEKGDNLEQIEIENLELPKTTQKFTRLWFIDLNVNFNDFIEGDTSKYSQLSLFDASDKVSEDIKIKENLHSALSFLKSPFENDTETFDINIYLNGKKIGSEFKNEALNVAETEHNFILHISEEQLSLELNMSLNPWYLERVHQRLVGKNLFSDWRRTPEEYEKILEKYSDKYRKSLHLNLNEAEIRSFFKELSLESIKKIAPIKGKVFSFKRDSSLSAMAIQSAKETNRLKRDYKITNIRKFLDSNNGIKLYRGKFRVTTLGDKDSDWLELQQARTKGQQFFRFELGNVIGYIEINDPFQDYIKETSSRINLADNSYSRSLSMFLKKTFNELFYSFSRSAYYITRDIFNDEKMLPTRPIEKLKEGLEANDKQVESSKEHLKEFETMLSKVEQTLNATGNVISEESLSMLKSLSSKGSTFKEIFEITLDQSKKQRELVKQVEHEKELIELESYNNYKLMANGLVTEVLTHEMHSILTNIESSDNIGKHLRNIEDYLLFQNKYDLYSNDFKPIKDQMTFFNNRFSELKHFYGFMEKTFLYKGTLDEFEEEDLRLFISNFAKRLENRLKTSKIKVDFSDIDMSWIVPRGVLIHIFYNLIDNSIHWIKERRKIQKYDKVYEREIEDYIKINKKDDYTIYYSDSGTGVFSRMENTLFQPLESGKERDGRGMGLYIVRQLLRSFGGDIQLLPDRNEYGNRYIFAIYSQVEEK